MSENKSFWQVGEVYRIETSLKGFVGELVELSDRGYVFKPFRLDKNAFIVYHDETKRKFTAPEWVDLGAIEGASLYEF